MRFYGFKAGELTTPDSPTSTSRRSQALLGLRHREFFPVDVNRGSKSPTPARAGARGAQRRAHPQGPAASAGSPCSISPSCKVQPQEGAAVPGDRGSQSRRPADRPGPTWIEHRGARGAALALSLDRRRSRIRPIPASCVRRVAIQPSFRRLALPAASRPRRGPGAGGGCLVSRGMNQDLLPLFDYPRRFCPGFRIGEAPAHLPAVSSTLARKGGLPFGPWALAPALPPPLAPGPRRVGPCSTTRWTTDVRRLAALEKAVRRDAHKMKAFVRFRRVVEEGGARGVRRLAPAGPTTSWSWWRLSSPTASA